MRAFHRLPIIILLLKNILVIAGGILFGQGIQTLAMPALTRLYSPNSYGAWSLFMSATALFSVVCGLRYEHAIVLPEKDEDAVNVLAIPVIVSLGFSGTLLVVFAFFRHSIAIRLGIPQLEPLLWIMPVFLLLNGLYQAGTFWSVRKKQFGHLASFRASQAVGTAGTQIGFGFGIGGASSGLVLGTLAGQFLGTAHLCFKHWKEYGAVFVRNFSWSRVRENAALYRNFPLYMAPYAFVGLLRDRGLFFLLGFFSGDQSVGWLTLAIKMMMLPNSLIAGSLSPVYFQQLAAAKRRADVEPLVMKTLLSLIFFATPPLVFLVFRAEELFSLAFGPQWTEAGGYARLLAPAALAMMLIAWMDRTPDVLGTQRLALIVEGSYAVAVLAAFTFCLFVLGSVPAAVASFSVVTVIYAVLWLILIFRLCGFSPRSLRKLGVLLVLDLAFFVAVFWLLQWGMEWRVAALVYSAITLLFFWGVYRTPGLRARLSRLTTRAEG